MKFTNAIATAFDRSETLLSDQNLKTRITLDGIDNLLAENAGRFCEKNPGDIFKVRQELMDWCGRKSTTARSMMLVVAIDKDHVRNMSGMHEAYRRKTVPTYRKILAVNIGEMPSEPGLGPDPVITYHVKDITDAYCRMSVTAD